MRTLPLAVAAVVLAAMAPPAAATTVHSCTPIVYAGTFIVESCSVTAVVNVQFLVKVFFTQEDVGAVVVQASGSNGGRVVIVCPVAAYVAVCGLPIHVSPAFAGTWTFTARPVVVDVIGNPYVKMEVHVD